jgi:FAD/FMN-containing dehydrogenase
VRNSGTFTRRDFLRQTAVGSLGFLAAAAIPKVVNASRTAWAALATRLKGPLIRPDHPRYRFLATPRNLRYAAMMPAGVALCADADDVATAIRWARDTGVPFAIRGGGHNYADASSSTGLIISTHRMRRVTVSGVMLHAQSGVRNAGLYRLLPKGGRGRHLLPGGNCPNVGIAGLTLGGGIGPNAPWAGLTADLLCEATMVTAEGDIVNASAQVNPELFWALRGGGGANFGVVTDLTYRLVEVPSRTATNFLLHYTGIDAIIDAGLAWQQARRIGGRLLSGTFLTAHNSNGLIARARGQILAAEDDAWSILAPLLSIPGVSIEISERTFWKGYQWYTTPISRSSSFWDRSLYSRDDLPSDLLERVVRVVSNFPTPESGYGAFGIMGWVGGRVNDIALGDTAYVHRDANALLEMNAGWPPTKHAIDWPTPVPAEIRAWMDELWELVYPHTTGQSYQNFPDPELKYWARAYYAENLNRLVAIKSVWDPSNVFTHGQGIKPM